METKYLKQKSLEIPMSRLLLKITNTLLHIPEDAEVYPVVGAGLAIFGLFQIIGVISAQPGILKMLFSWADPNTYLGSAFAVISGTILTLLYLFLLGLRLSFTEEETFLVKPRSWLTFLGIGVSYLRAIC
jgi:hypothetical protein